MRIASQLLNVCVATALCVSANPAVFAADTPDGDDPGVVNTKAGSALEARPHKPREHRLAVHIYEFHRVSPDLSVTVATDMFTAALVKSGQFRVVERQRLMQGVVYEKQLNAAGQTSGDTAQKQLRGARYIFEGTVTEANASENQRQTGVSIGGLTLGGGKNKDRIAIDVRILDAESGDVLDSVSVSKALHDSSVGVGGTAALAGTLASMSGHSANPLTPDVNYQSSRKESIDKALRACIETAV